MPTAHAARPSGFLVRFAMALALSLAVATPAAGADVPQLQNQITDQTGLLAGHTADIATALTRLQRDHNVQLWVLFTGSTGATSITAYADQVAAANSLGVNDALLVVATDDRTDSIWVSNGLPQIANDEVDSIISQQVEPRLASGDFAGAVIAAADGLGTAAGGAGPVATSGGTPPPAVNPPPASSDTGSSIVIGLIAAILIVAGIYLVLLFVVRRRSETRTAEENDRDTGDLARRANHDLIAADEVVRDAQQELGFVEAEFDEPDIAPFRTAVDGAATEVKAAFVIRQQLDDDVPEDPATRRQLLEGILKHTTTATALLKAQEDRLQQLRDVRRHAPEVLTQLEAQIATLADRLDKAQATLVRLSAFADPSWASVKGNGAEADKRLAFARDAITRGRTGLQQQDQREVGIAIRDAQGAIGEATALLDAVERLAASLDDANARLPQELAAAAADIAAARQALSGADAGVGAGVAVSSAAVPAAGNAAAGAGTAAATAPVDEQQRLLDAQHLLDLAHASASATPPDVLDAFKNATAANAAADAIVAAVREEAARIARRQQVLDGAIRSASMAVARSNDFVQTRRGGVGQEARTRLVEAQRQLDLANATQTSDPDGALQAAQRAQSVANDAYLIASQQFDQFDQQGPPAGGYGGGGAGVQVGATILGGIIGGMLSGGIGGRRGGWGGGGWGGTPWGSPPGSGGTGFGGFGGGGGRASGGSWGGLGGRSRGGRW